jgi:hypothetical protein
MLWEASEALLPIQKVHDLLWEKHKEGYIIDIITARESCNLPEVKQYIEEYKLPIRHVEATAGRPKSPILKMSKSVLHVDDMVTVAVDCKMNGINILLVDDGRHKNNTTADEFDRILI